MSREMRFSRGTAVTLALMALGTVACQDEALRPGSGKGTLVLRIVSGENLATRAVFSRTGYEPEPSFSTFTHLDEMEVVLDGPTDTIVALEDSSAFFVGRIEDLEPGTYHVAVKGYVDGELDYFGESTTIEVVEDQDRAVTVSFQSFVPVLSAFTTPTTRTTIPINFTAITAADSYLVELDRGPSFPNPTGLWYETRAAAFTINDTDTLFARVRAANHFGIGRPSETQRVAIVVDTTEPDVGQVLPFASSGTYRGLNLLPLNDIDIFAVEACALDTLEVTVLAGGANPASNLDPLLVILNPAIDSIDANDDISATDLDSHTFTVLDTNGLHIMGIGASDAANTANPDRRVGHYDLVVRIGRGLRNTGSACLDPVATVTIGGIPPNNRVLVGATAQLTATMRDANNIVLTGRTVAWTSSQVGLGTVTPGGGLVAGVAAVGTTRITATSEGVSSFVDILVASPMAIANVTNAGASSTPAGVNLSNGTMAVTRTALGQYSVVFNGLGTSGGIGTSFGAFVNATASAANASLTVPTAVCHMTNYFPNQPLTVLVRCEDPVTAADKDAQFRVLVVGDNVLGGTGAPGQLAMFSGHTNTGAAAAYSALPAFSWRSDGGVITIVPGAGSIIAHQHQSIGAVVPQGILVTAATTGFGDACIAWTVLASETQVICYRRGVGPINLIHTVLRLRGGRPTRAAGYAHINGSDGVLFAGGSFTSSGGAITTSRSAAGRYRVVFAGMSVTGANVGILTTPQGSGARFACTQFLAVANPVTIDVACTNDAGAFADVGGGVGVLIIE